MNVAIEKSVRELALENPVATRVFEKLGIDYCCGGNKTLEEACRSFRRLRSLSEVNCREFTCSTRTGSQTSATSPWEKRRALWRNHKGHHPHGRASTSHRGRIGNSAAKRKSRTNRACR